VPATATWYEARAPSAAEPPSYDPQPYDSGSYDPYLLLGSASSAEGPAYEPAYRPAPSRPGPGLGLWFGAAGLLLAVLVLAFWLLAHGHTSSPIATSPGPSAIVPPVGHHSHRTGSSHSPAATSSPPSPTATPTGTAEDVAGLAVASAPAHAPAGVDLDGRPVTFEPANMVDGDPQTCWRTIGDATTMVLTFTLDQPTQISRVGMVNGYAKVAFSGGRRYDWYHGHRRVLVATWIFDDGTTVGQHLTDTMAMQTMKVTPVTTRRVRLRIDAVSPPGRGPASRNETAVSEVSLVGRTG
jgi:hypothetical protein